MKKAVKTVYVQQRNPAVSVLANLIMDKRFDIFETCQVNRRAEFEHIKIIVAMSSYTSDLDAMTWTFIAGRFCFTDWDEGERRILDFSF